VIQNPQDLPEDILTYFGLKVRHALRAFKAKDRKAIELSAENLQVRYIITRKKC